MNDFVFRSPQKKIDIFHPIFDLLALFSVPPYLLLLSLKGATLLGALVAPTAKSAKGTERFEN